MKKAKRYFPFDNQKLSKCHNVPFIEGTNLCIFCKKPSLTVISEKKEEIVDLKRDNISKENPFAKNN